MKALVIGVAGRVAYVQAVQVGRRRSASAASGHFIAAIKQGAEDGIADVAAGADDECFH